MSNTEPGQESSPLRPSRRGFLAVSAAAAAAGAASLASPGTAFADGGPGPGPSQTDFPSGPGNPMRPQAPDRGNRRGQGLDLRGDAAARGSVQRPDDRREAGVHAAGVGGDPDAHGDHQ